MITRFMQQKEEAQKSLAEAKLANETDPEAMALVDYVNSLKDYYTTSSCSGRICLLHDVGSKLEAEWIGKWHRKVTFEEVMDAFENRPKEGRIRFIFESAIFHIVARDVACASKVVTIARNFGFKRVGIISVKEERNTVEVCSTERFDAPISDSGRALVDENYIKYLVDLGNMRFDEGIKKLRRLEQGLRKNLF
jgi:tRNA wybutosine-synthesizing protein 3